MSKKIGIFAGTFDPIHDGHLALAERVKDELKLDKLVFLVEEEPWNGKKPTASLVDRQAMVSISLKKYAGMRQLTLHQKRFDITRTLPALQKRYMNHRLFFVFGSDIFLKMNSKTWPKLNSLLAHSIVVVKRRHDSKGEINKHANTIGAEVSVIDSPKPHHRSTDIRLSPQHKIIWLPVEVADYIDKHQLYL